MNSVMIATVANRDCLKGVRRLLASLKVSGNNMPVVVYTPEDETALLMGDVDAPVVPLPRWWSRDGRIAAAPNGPAVLKVSAIHHALQNSLSVLYLDGADVLVNGDLMPLFSMCRGSCADVAAHSFSPGRALLHQSGEAQLLMAPWMAGEAVPYVNNGVVWFRRSPYSDMFLLGWRAMLLSPSPRFPPSKPLVGDQEDFNIFFREAYRQQRAMLLGPEWNVRGFEGIQSLRAREGRVTRVGDAPAYILHASGQANRFPWEIVKICAGAAHV
jgi:hypothetical protein